VTYTLNGLIAASLASLTSTSRSRFRPRARKTCQRQRHREHELRLVGGAFNYQEPAPAGVLNGTKQTPRARPCPRPPCRLSRQRSLAPARALPGERSRFPGTAGRSTSPSPNVRPAPQSASSPPYVGLTNTAGQGDHSRQRIQRECERARESESVRERRTAASSHGEQRHADYGRVYPAASQGRTYPVFVENSTGAPVHAGELGDRRRAGVPDEAIRASVAIDLIYDASARPILVANANARSTATGASTNALGTRWRSPICAASRCRRTGGDRAIDSSKCCTSIPSP